MMAFVLPKGTKALRNENSKESSKSIQVDVNTSDINHDRVQQISRKKASHQTNKNTPEEGEYFISFVSISTALQLRFKYPCFPFNAISTIKIFIIAISFL